ncbi:MAG: T9SS type A sorting domain-containing protein [Reichenbachiella sp.]|uniref:T9SS type A sorting domain-containing protein n=1 Tax=Reichenbachiella sp. TaxID=2184521 RepID=UPI0032657250
MKASLNLFLVVAFTTIANVALANVDRANDVKSTEIVAQIYPMKGDMIYVQLEKAGKGKVYIQISDLNGHVLHSESMKDDIRILKRFDISNLPSGSYIYEVSTDRYSLKKRIEKE